MIIVYLSLALAVTALVYLGVSAFRTLKAVQPTMKSLSDTAADVQKQIEGVQNEKEQLLEKVEGFRMGIQEKKQLVQSVGANVKWSIEELKALWSLARMVPNPKRVARVEMSPEVARVTDQVVDWLERLRGWRR